MNHRRSLLSPLMPEKSLEDIKYVLQVNEDKYLKGQHEGIFHDIIDRASVTGFHLSRPIEGLDRHGGLLSTAKTENVLSAILAISVDPQFEELYLSIEDSPEEYLGMFVEKAAMAYPVKFSNIVTQYGLCKTRLDGRAKRFYVFPYRWIEQLAELLLLLDFTTGDWHMTIPWSRQSPPFYNNFLRFLPDTWNAYMVDALIEAISNTRGRHIGLEQIAAIGTGLLNTMIQHSIDQYNNEDELKMLMQFWFTGKPIDEENQYDYLQSYFYGINYMPEDAKIVVPFMGHKYAVIWEA